MAGDRSYSKLGAHLPDLLDALREREQDAEALLDAGRYAASIVQGIYALEICLKVAICRRLDIEQLPRAFEIHDLGELLVLSGLSKKLIEVESRDAAWQVVINQAKFVNHLRYTSGSECSRNQADDLFSTMFDASGGLIVWIKQHIQKNS
jgi:hypothetical protein